jgi:hypothetical protein
MQWAAFAAFLMIAAILTVNFGSHIRTDTPCNDAADCEADISVGGKWVVAGGVFLGIASIAAVLHARAIPTQPPPRKRS